MQALIVIDAQNEFSENGKRPVPNFLSAVERIRTKVKKARKENSPIAWIRHFNKPNESSAFMPNTWGSEFYFGFGPHPENIFEKEFQKDVFGAFAGTDVGIWLDSINVRSVCILGFYTHACVSTTAREALMLKYNVTIDYEASGACDITHEFLGGATADEVRKSALLQLSNMGAIINWDLD